VSVRRLASLPAPLVSAQYKRATMTGIAALGGLMLRCVPEFGEPELAALRLDFTATLG